MKIAQITHFFLLAAFALVWTAGCATSKPEPDPLDGWRMIHSNQLSKTIVNDYQDYIQKLPPDVRYNVEEYNIRFFESGAGQRAVKISIPQNGVWQVRIIFYDKNDIRTKAIKYLGSNYRS